MSARSLAGRVSTCRPAVLRASPASRRSRRCRPSWCRRRRARASFSPPGRDHVLKRRRGRAGTHRPDGPAPGGPSHLLPWPAAADDGSACKQATHDTAAEDPMRTRMMILSIVAGVALVALGCLVGLLVTLGPWLGLGVAAAVAAVVLALYLLAVRPWHLRWDASDQEVARAMPGDGLVDGAGSTTRAITVTARAEQVWPW